jgi:predicted ATPase/DNA-binding winged helix-turn-helix (wHTH) protein
MKQDRQILFPPFRLDVINRRLYRGQQELALRPKTLAVLIYLLERPGRLVTKNELLDAVWTETSVSDAVLKVSIREIREALGDDQKQPKFIATAQRVGYRFIGEVATNNIPLPLTSFIGRVREMAEIRQLLAGTRLLTLTGTGGSGKTRLAIEMARDLVGEFDDDVWWVELAALSDPASVTQAVTSILGVRENPGRALLDTLTAHLRSKQLLLVLDNCEHLIAACAAVADALLHSCPQLKILATSREPLAVPGETTWTVPPLSLPDPSHLPPLDELLVYEAVHLFVDRAAAALPDFAATPESAPALSLLCQRLDGLPLAIELAASRVKVLGLEQIAARLDHCFQLLTAGSRTVLPRHQTLRATIDWSYELLPEDERTLLARLSVFAGWFTLEAAEKVCAGGSIAEDKVLDLLSHLIDKSLVVVTQREGNGQTRYRLLETVRQYGQERLSAIGETTVVRLRHVSFYLNLAEEVEPKINTAERSQWVGRLEREHDNLRAALRYMLELQSTESALRMVGALFWFWFHGGFWTEGRGWIAAALSRPVAQGPTKLRAKALYGQGVLGWTMGDHAAARAQLEESAEVWRAVGDEHGLAHTIHFLGVELLSHGELARARALNEESLGIFRALQNDRWGLAVACASLGIVAMAQRDDAAAQPLLEESISICRELKDGWALALPLRNLGIMALRQGDYDRAAALLRESLIVLRPLKERWFLSRSIESLAQVLALRGDYEQAARLFGAGEALREALGATVLPFYRVDYERGIATLRAGLNEASLAAAWDAGRAMSIEETIAYALGEWVVLKK